MKFIEAYELAKSGKEVAWDNGYELHFTEWHEEAEKLLWMEADSPDGNLVTLNRNTMDGWVYIK